MFVVVIRFLHKNIPKNKTCTFKMFKIFTKIIQRIAKEKKTRRKLNNRASNIQNKFFDRQFAVNKHIRKAKE